MTKEMKQALKENIAKMIKEKMVNTTVINFETYEEVLSSLDNSFLDTIRDEKITHQYIGSLLSYIAGENNLKYENLTLWFHYSVSDITNINKEKNILEITFTNNRIAHYDFNKEEFIEEWSKGLCFGKYLCKEVEWVYNYPELFENAHYMCLFAERVRKKSLSCPKGLIPWLKEKNKFLTYENYYNYLFKDCTCKFSDYVISDNNNIDFYLQNYKIIDKLICNENNIRILYNAFYNEAIRLLKEMNSMNYKYDLNRGIYYNKEQFKEWENKHRNEILSLNLQKLNFLNNLEIGEYIIKIPQSIEDLQTEGRQQNNCVGHYYNNSIIRGENLIYFLRRKDHMDDSYITARYNLRDSDTVEYRKKNNRIVKDESDITIIKQITEMITNYLQNRRD